MAHTDACKFQVCQFVEKCVKNGMTVNEASKHAQTESDGIPAETIRRWWKEIQNANSEELVKNDQPAENAPTIGDCCGKACTDCTASPESVMKMVEAKVGEGMEVKEAISAVAKEVAKAARSSP